jgi:hypothetical protein
MANLNEFQVDMRAIKDGAWTRVHEAYGDLEIQVRGITDEYIDSRTARMIAAAEPYGGDEKRIPNADVRRINASLMEEFLIIGVRNLHDGDQEVTLEQFHKLLYRPDYARLTRLCWEAVFKINSRSVAQIETASKNSPQDSASS